MRIRIARRSDAMEIARLHMEVLGGMGASFLPRLGLEALSDLYSLMIATEPNGIRVAQNETHVIGLIAGTANTRRITLLSIRMALKVLFGCYDLEMKRSMFLLQGLKHSLYLFNRRPGQSRSELLDIVVHPRYQGRGVGSELVKVFLEYLGSTGSKNVQVLVDVRWTRALSFYKKMNFMPVGKVETPSGVMWVLTKRIS